MNIEYQEITPADDDHENIIRFFSMAFAYIDNARSARGRVLVYGSGVSRSGAICLGYIIRSVQSVQLKQNDRSNQFVVLNCTPNV